CDIEILRLDKCPSVSFPRPSLAQSTVEVYRGSRILAAGSLSLHSMTDMIYWYKEALYTSSKSYQANQRASMTRRDDSEHTRRMELASFLRPRRERLRPEQVGLPLRPRRRTPGLRREEVAELIGIGVTWYTWLEQARPIHVSADVVEQLARVFQLSKDERAY